MSDQELMRLVALGDADAFTQLVQQYRSRAEGLACSILHDAAQSEDIVQEAFARVWLLRQRYDEAFAFRTWLAAIVRHLCIDHLRRQRHAPVLPGELPEQLTGSAEAEYLQKEARMQLWDELRALDERDRRLLIGYALQGKSYRELADEAGTSVALVKIRLHRIRKLLKSKGA